MRATTKLCLAASVALAALVLTSVFGAAARGAMSVAGAARAARSASVHPPTRAGAFGDAVYERLIAPLATAVSAPAISAGPDLVLEESDDHVDIPVTLSAPGTGTVSVSYSTVNAGAGGGFGCNADYTPASGTLTFLPGETSKAVRVFFLDCPDVEGLEAFTLNLSNPAGGATIARAKARILIVDNDTVVEGPRIIVRDAIVDEKSGFAFVPILLGGPGGTASGDDVTVDYQTVDGTAAAGSDYTAKSGKITFDPGEVVKNVVVPITDDGDAEQAETFQVKVIGWSGALWDAARGS